MSKRYATPESDADELRIMNLVFKKMNGLGYKKLPPKCQADFALMGENSSVIGIVEIKSRKTLLSTQFSTYRISLNKVLALEQWSRRVPTYLVVEFKDAIRWWRIPKEGLKVTETLWGGRTDRNDPNDMEIMVGIPIKGSRVLKKRSR